MISAFATVQCGQVMVDSRSIRSALGRGRIARLCGRGCQLVHIGFGVVIDDRCRLVLEGHGNLGNAGNGFQASLDDGWAGCQSAFKFGSDAILVQLLFRAD